MQGRQARDVERSLFAGDNVRRRAMELQSCRSAGVREFYDARINGAVPKTMPTSLDGHDVR